MEQNKWSTGLKCDLAPDCSYKDKITEPTVHIPLPVYLVIRQLCKDIAIEWQMFLIGTVDGNMYNVTNYFIPKQLVTASSVEDDDNLPTSWYKENNVIGTLHSHGTMAVFFSGTDDTNNQNSPVACHVVVNNADEYLACIRTTLPCGMEAFVKCGVSLEVPAEQKIVVNGVDKIKKYTYEHNFANDDQQKNQRENYYGVDSVYLGEDALGKPMWGTQEELDEIERAQSFGFRNADYKNFEPGNYYNKKKKSKGLYPWRGKE